MIASIGSLMASISVILSACATMTCPEMAAAASSSAIRSRRAVLSAWYVSRPFWWATAAYSWTDLSSRSSFAIPQLQLDLARVMLVVVSGV